MSSTTGASSILLALLLLGAAVCHAQPQGRRAPTEMSVCWAAPSARTVRAVGVEAVRQHLQHVLDVRRPTALTADSALAWMRHVDAKLLDLAVMSAVAPTYVTVGTGARDLDVGAVCDADGGGVDFELRIARASARASATPTGWIHAGARRLRWSVVDGVLIGVSTLAPAADRVAMVQQLRALERAFGSRAEPPAILLVLRDTAELRTVFPLRWRDNLVREHTFIAHGGPSVGFLALRGQPTSLHELVHVALSGRVQRAEDSMAGPVSYFFEEALARAIGGSEGRPFDEVARRGERDARALAALTAQHAESTVTAVRAGRHAGVLRDVVAGVYRVLLRHCRAIPAGVLEIGEEQPFGHFLTAANAQLALAPLEFLLASATELSLPWPTLMADLEQPTTARCLARGSVR